MANKWANQSPDDAIDHGRVYGWLKTMLVEYRFGPDAQLTICEVADHLRVSATPVRESLIRLRAESFLDTAPRRGFFVRPLCCREMKELHELIFSILRQSVQSLHAHPGEHTLSWWRTSDEERLMRMMDDQIEVSGPALAQ